MEYRTLGRTATKVSPLCLGCMMFGGKTSPEDSYVIIDRALDAGINFLDTANVYSRGRSEEVTGEALKRNGKRHQVVLATKVHGTMDDNDPNALAPAAAILPSNVMPVCAVCKPTTLTSTRCTGPALIHRL